MKACNNCSYTDEAGCMHVCNTGYCQYCKDGQCIKPEVEDA